MVTIDLPIAAPIACVHTKSIYRSMQSSKLYWSTKVCARMKFKEFITQQWNNAFIVYFIFIFVSIWFLPNSVFYFLVQQPNLSHPFHLHGFSYSVIGMPWFNETNSDSIPFDFDDNFIFSSVCFCLGIGRSPDTNVKKINLKHALDLDRRGLLHRQYNLPPSKDTIAVPNNGYVVLRFRADNPGKIFISQLKSAEWFYLYIDDRMNIV